MLLVCDLVYIGSVLVAVFFSAWAMLFGTKKSYDKDILCAHSFYVKKKNAFLRSSIIWLSIYYWLYLCSVLGTVLIVYIDRFHEEDNIHIFVYSVLSLFFLMSELIINPQKVANGYRKAYMKMDYALNTKRNRADDISVDLAKELNKCEKIIKKVHK